MRLTPLLVALFGLCVCLSFAEESVVEDDVSQPLDARNAILGKGKGKPKPAVGGSKSTKATSKPTSKAAVVSNKASKSAFQVTTKGSAANVTGSKTTSLVATTSSSSTGRSSSISSGSSVASTSSSLISSSLAVSTSTASTSKGASTSSPSNPASGSVSPTSSITSASTTNVQYCTPTISKKNLLKTTICICPDGIRASASKTPNPPCPYTTVPPLSAMLPMQDTDANSGDSFWGKAWEVAKPHAGHVAGKAGQFAVDRYGQPIKDKFDHLIPVKGQDVSAADLAQVDPVQMEQAEESEAAEVDHSTHENGRSGVDDGQAGVVQGAASVDGGAVKVGHGDGVDDTATQASSQDVGQAGQENGSPSRNLGHNDEMGNTSPQRDGASHQSGAGLDNMEGESPNDTPGQGNRGNAAGNRAGTRGNQGEQNPAAQSGDAQSEATQQGVTQDAGSDDINNDPDPGPNNQPEFHIRPRRVASSMAVSPSLNWNGTSSSGGGVSPSGSAPSVPLGNGTTSDTNGNDNPACPVHGDVSPDEMQGDDDPDSALSVGIQSECKQKRDILRVRTVSTCSPTVISSGSTFTSTIVCNEDVVTARDEICDPSRSTAASGGSFATGSATGSAGGSIFFPNGTATSDPIMETANASLAANHGARKPRPRDGGPFIVDKSYAGSGSNSSVRSRMAGTAYSGIDTDDLLNSQTYVMGTQLILSKLLAPGALRFISDAQWAILSTPPPTPYVYVKAPVDSSAYVGNLTATALSSALYSALSVTCPDEECQPNATIPEIMYPGSHGDMKEGELVITIHDGHLYTKDEGIRNLTFTLAAMLANASSTEMCFDYSRAIGNRDPGPAPLVPPPPMVRPLKTEEILLCNMAGLMLIEYYSGNRTDGPDTRLFLSFSFRDHEGGSDMTAEICEKVMLGMDIAGTLLACIPIIGPIINAVMKASKAACRMAEKVEETADEIDAAISAGTEVVDNLLSLKSDLPLSLSAI
ncbi:hypothetical protein KC360_g8839 [Hortaea werneckii]|nr:hypothetical protein KC325_g9019 [Hortaea werneckii]KAI6986546.1 hypothetical protein KC359_g8689 [Hortaea werneckii]KAI7139975.1 hypothetical protein KC344_g9030 [Hortaea werneckii]KAI7167103.1 hypothetical protein KC360_g8839 [Hortaea werneckii]